MALGDRLERQKAVNEVRAGEQIMTSAERFEAGMLVTGAYGRSRVREIIFGGATKR